MPDVSIIIPCFNQGCFIHEAIDSALGQTNQNLEIIVVNDGSTDPATVEIVNRINHPKIKVIHTDNQGLASARNNGIREAHAEFILPLDADDKIAPTYVEKGVAVLKKDPEIGIVYCLAELFGEKNGFWNMPEYSLKEMLFQNVIFHCAFFRRSDWQKTNGYNSAMRFGLEDWDFWMSIISLGKKVHRIPEVLHYYRVRKESMVHKMSDAQRAAMASQVFLNHQEFYRQHALEFFEEIICLKKTSGKSLFDILSDKARHPLKTLGNFMNRFMAHT